MRCCAPPARTSSTAWRRTSPASTRGCRPTCSDDEIAAFLASRKRLERVAIRHTVGLDDKIEGEGGVADPSENAGARYFKLKLNGDPDARCRRA